MTKTKSTIALITIILAVGGLGYYVYANNYTPSTEQVVEKTDDEQQADDSEDAKTDDSNNETVAEPTENTGSSSGAFKEKQVYSEERFRIIQTDDKSYKVTLYAIINRPDQQDFYREQLKEYKQAALDYMKSNNLPTSDIDWDPNEAENV